MFTYYTNSDPVQVVAKREARAKAKERREYKENTSARLDEEAKARYKAK